MHSFTVLYLPKVCVLSRRVSFLESVLSWDHCTCDVPEKENFYSLTPYFSFSVRIEFRAVQPNGILFYLASSPLPTAANYFGVYMRDGFLGTSMQASPFNPNTLNLQTSITYNNGEWWEVRPLRHIRSHFLKNLKPQIDLKCIQNGYQGGWRTCVYFHM